MLCSDIATYLLTYQKSDAQMSVSLYACLCTYCCGLTVWRSTHTWKALLFVVVTQVAIVTSLGAAPWVVKPVYGFLSDTVPIFGYRRRSYLIICGLLGEHPSERKERKVCAFWQS